MLANGMGLARAFFGTAELAAARGPFDEEKYTPSQTWFRFSEGNNH